MKHKITIALDSSYFNRMNNLRIADNEEFSWDNFIPYLFDCFEACNEGRKEGYEKGRLAQRQDSLRAIDEWFQKCDDNDKGQEQYDDGWALIQKEDIKELKSRLSPQEQERSRCGQTPNGSADKSKTIRPRHSPVDTNTRKEEIQLGKYGTVFIEKAVNLSKGGKI